MNPLLSSVCFFSWIIHLEDLGASLTLTLTLIASALVVNTNEKTTAASVLMSTFFALKFLFVIIINFKLLIDCHLLCRLFPFDDAKVWQFSRKKNFLLTFASVCCDSDGNLRHIGGNIGWGVANHHFPVPHSRRAYQPRTPWRAPYS